MMENQSKESNALNLGDRGARIEELHNMLKSLNFEVTEPLDCFTEKTKNSIIKFQEQRGLPVSGQCDQKTWDVLVENSFVLGDRLLYLSRPMLRGEDIAELQRSLGSLGFNPGKVDGIFGPDTQDAVELFQRNSGLVVDAIFGPKKSRRRDLFFEKIVASPSRDGLMDRSRVSDRSIAIDRSTDR